MEAKEPQSWIDVTGKWTFQSEKGKGTTVSYSGNDIKTPLEYGLCLNEGRLTQGTISTTVNFLEMATEARILFGYNSRDNNYLTAGLGGWESGYTIQEFIPTFGWRGLKMAGSIKNLRPNKDYELEVRIYGNQIKLIIDEVEILEHIMSQPLSGDQIGLFTVGNSKVEFKNYRYESEMADVFVVMQFSEPYDSLYKEVIVNVAKEFKLNAYRSDDVFGPGVILKDIIKGIIESTIIIAEITPSNPNVFYELGYAHALGKATILLVEKGQALPFDIQGYRAIFYENTIKGKKSVEENLRKHLKAILRR